MSTFTQILLLLDACVIAVYGGFRGEQFERICCYVTAIIITVIVSVWYTSGVD